MGVVCCSLMYVPRWVWHVHVAHTQRGGKKKKKTEGTGVWDENNGQWKEVDL